MKWLIKNQDFLSLIEEISCAVNKALKDRSCSEPQLVANLVFEIPKIINKRGLKIGKFNICSGGIFVHAQPFVTCKDFPKETPKSVEIGDLLLLRTEKYNNKVVHQHALLLQAKKITSLPARPDNKNQHYFYSNWPSFEYVRSRKLNGKKRHVTGHDLYNASRFLLIPTNNCCCCGLFGFFCDPLSRCVITASPTSPELMNYRCFVNEIVDFILGDAGKEFINPPAARSRGWDRVIQDLVNETSKLSSRFMEKASGNNMRSHGVFFSGGSDGACGVFSELNNLFCQSPNEEKPPSIAEGWESDDESHMGISIIEFTVSSDA